MKTQVTVKAIVCATAKIGQMTVGALRGETRARDVVYYRQAAQFVAYERLGLSYLKIGRLTGRDHTTVIHGIRRVRVLLETEPDRTRQLLNDIWSTAQDIAAEHVAEGQRRVVIEPPAAPQQPEVAAEAAPEAGVVPNPWKYQQFTPDWWRANDLAFRQGLARAYGIGEAAA